MKNRYRVVRDNWLGFEAQVKYWWFPLIWFQLSSTSGLGCNTRATLADSQELIELHKAGKLNRVVWKDTK